MQLRIFTVPALNGDVLCEEMNRFLRGHRVVTVDKQFCMLGDSACWSFCVTYVEGPPLSSPSKPGEQKVKVDYKGVLAPAPFAVFSRLREIRKILAAEDAVPAYAVFTDAELAEISQLPQLDVRSILTIKGVASARAEKYGSRLCKLFVEQPAPIIG